jgi:hypothetical protein
MKIILQKLFFVVSLVLDTCASFKLFGSCHGNIAVSAKTGNRICYDKMFSA